MPAACVTDVSLDARNWLAGRHFKRREWWADLLRASHGDLAAAVRTARMTQRLMLAAQAEVMLERHDAWTTGLVRGVWAVG